MWFNLIIRVKPYQLLPGVAWLSSARVVRRVAKARNGQNPYLQLLEIKFRTLQEFLSSNRNARLIHYLTDGFLRTKFPILEFSRKRG